MHNRLLHGCRLQPATPFLLERDVLRAIWEGDSVPRKARVTGLRNEVMVCGRKVVME